ncbi:carbohydrate ABC transporter permease [Arthrobacter woluwensis]|uniref:carbohydrate ABC transporter permease n=1 Tax=Arthrobacter woluwensis TaxID=156980 RepID=UPI001AAFA13E|nr:carbohydrate ABC transporter permease [Arthrobacter woluwensis]QTF72596.1 carbohydrate ABC transporter permease [Arthrobacter woluwensis]
MSVDVVRGERRGVMGAQGGKRKPFRVTAFLSSCAVAVVALVFAFPILWMFLSAFKSTRSIVEDAFPLSWKSFVPAHPVLDNFVHLFTQLGFAQNFLNTVIVSVCQVALTVVVATLAGYALSRLNFRGA